MKPPLLLLLAGCFTLGGCGKREVVVAEANPTESLVARIGETGHVVFESWDGKPRGMDSDSALHFYKDSRVVLEDRGIGITYHQGSYDLKPEGRVVVTLKDYREAWPLMILRREGADLLLHHEDSHTSWLPKDHPNPDASVDGFWPFRTNTKTITQQVGASDGDKPPN